MPTDESFSTGDMKFIIDSVMRPLKLSNYLDVTLLFGFSGMSKVLYTFIIMILLVVKKTVKKNSSGRYVFNFYRTKIIKDKTYKIKKRLGFPFRV